MHYLSISWKPFQESSYPVISEYVAEFDTIDSDIRLILEPGRSLIANCAILVADVIGIKASCSFSIILHLKAIQCVEYFIAKVIA